MPRLKNINSGAVVSVPDEKAARMGSEWEPADAAPKKATAKKAASSKSEK